MDIASEIRQLLPMRKVAENYGYTPGRSGFIQCPFHQGDRTASLKMYDGDRGWKCFACGKGGSVIDFVMELYGITFRQAVLRLNEDFGLGLTGSKPDSRKAAERSRKLLEEAKELDEYRWRHELMTARYRRLWRAYKTKGPQYPQDPIDDEYAEACIYLPYLDHWFADHPWR